MIRIIYTFICLSLALLFWGGSASAEIESNGANFEGELAKIDIVYLGETHDRLQDHQAQKAILESLYLQNPKLAIALEMFQRPAQKFLNSYLAGEINEEQLERETEYDFRWGFDWELYAPILRFAKSHQLPILALNAPSEVTTKIALRGLESLAPEDFDYIPPFSEIRTDNDKYRQMLLEIYRQHLKEAGGNSQDFERFFTVQVVWDETMAEKIAQFWQANRDYQVIVLAGKGHVIYGYGIPDRVERRLHALMPRQRTVLLGES